MSPENAGSKEEKPMFFCGQIINVLYHTKKDEYNQKKTKTNHSSKINQTCND